MGVQVALGAIAITPYAIACLLYVRLWTDGYGMVEVLFSHLAMESGVPGYGFSPFLYNTLLSAFDPGDGSLSALRFGVCIGAVSVLCPLGWERVDGCVRLGCWADLGRSVRPGAGKSGN